MGASDAMRLLVNYFNEFAAMLPSIGFWDILDILVVAFIIYKGINLIHTTAASRIAKGILVLIVITALTGILEMRSLNYILSMLLEVGAIALIIIFQPELRRFLESFGSRSISSIWQGKDSVTVMESTITQVVLACEKMSKERVGALIVFERDTSTAEYFKTGTLLNAQVSTELIRNIFFPKAALHDGAMIIQADQIAAAGCVLPLSENTHLSSDLGTRHRAGVGMSEVSDAVVVIVSEETGAISVAQGGMLKRHLAPQMLEKLLRQELIRNPEQTEKNLKGYVRSFFDGKGDKHGKK